MLLLHGWARIAPKAGSMPLIVGIAAATFAWCFAGAFAAALVDLIQSATTAQLGIDLAFVDILISAMHFRLRHLAALTVSGLIMLMWQTGLVFRFWVAVFPGAEKAGHKILTF
jgi:hypothetical protein